MNAITLTVNGQPEAATVAPRTHLADFLREELSLTGTHLGCEQGVCGACTVLVDGEPVRSCIAYAVTCDGSDVRTIEGFGDDPLMAELREAFSEHHGLQCGFCTPGMLITSRDIIRRYGEMDEATIRYELSGNLCRCTGYMGIVRAVRSVSLGKAPAPAPSRRPPHAEEARNAPSRSTQERGASFETQASPAPQDDAVGNARPYGPAAATPAATMAPASSGGWTELRQVVTVAAPADQVWAQMKDLHAVASCLPGASVTSVEGARFAGKLAVKFGPIRATFDGDGTASFEDGTSSGLVEGGGRDPRTGTQARGEIRFAVREAGAGSEIDVAIRYRMTGALAQFARTSLVQNFVGHLAGLFAANLARLTAGEPAGPAAAAAPELNTLAILLAVAKDWLRRLVGR